MRRCSVCGGRSADGAHVTCEGARPIEAAPIAAPGVDVPGYTTTGVLGGGGFGTVVQAVRDSDGAQVAIKIAHASPEARARLARERELLRVLEPPRVPRLYDHGTLADDAPFIAMELVGAPTLAVHMARATGPLAPPAIVELVAPVVAAVTELHARGVVHRDLKPENVFVDGTRATLVDFGLARAAGLAAVTAANQVAGTPIYQAPEQVDGEVGTPAVDVYALGIILYELATGRPPFFGTDAEIRLAHAAQRPPPPREHAALPAAFEAVILDCLAKDPARRPRAGELAARLAGTAAGEAEPSPVAASQRARLACALLAFEPTGAPADIARVVGHHHGELAAIHGSAWTAVFSPVDGGRPAARAQRAGADLVAAGLARHSAVERRELVMRMRADGTHQILTSLAPVVGADDAPAMLERPAEPTFVGRAELLCELVGEARDAFARASAGRRAIVAPDGTGRTRFARRLAAELTPALDARVVHLEMRELVAGAPAHGLVRVAQALLEHDDEPPAATMRGAALADALGLAADPAELARLRATPGAYRAELAHSLAAAIVEVARRRPLVAIVDDAHFVDPTTLDAIRIATDTGAPFWCCAIGRRPPWRDEPATLLTSLAPAELGIMCRELLLPAIDVPDGAIARIVERARGNPGALVAACDALHASGAIKPRLRGGDWYLDTEAVVHDLRAFDHDAVASLDPTLANHAAVLALLAPGFDVFDAEAIVHRLPRTGFPLDARVAVHRLCVRGVLAERDGVLGFRDPALRDTLAGTLAPEHARQVHAAAAARLQHLAVARPGDRELLARLAPHVAAIGDRVRAVEILVELADATRDVHDYIAAEALYGRALELHAGDANRELQLRRMRALMRRRLGRYEDALADLERALDLAVGDRVLEIELLLDEATALDWNGEYARSTEAVEQARARCRSEDGAVIETRMLVAEGRSLWRRVVGNAAAIERLERAEAIARSLGDVAYEDRIAALVMLVFLLPTVGRHDDAERIAADTIALCEQRSDRHHLMIALNNRQVISLQRGEVARAIADLERADAIGRELGIPIQRYRSQLSLADLHRRLGDHAAAVRCASAARAVETDGSGAGAQQSAAIVLVQLHHSAGELAELRALLASLDRATLHEEEAFVARAIELALAGDAGAWSALAAEVGARVPELLADLIEHRALAARHRGELALAQAYYADAIAAAERHDPIAIARLVRGREALP